MSINGFCAGKPLQCLSIAIVLHKEQIVSTNGQLISKVGFKLGGGIDQDPIQSPFKYPDTGVYITFVEPNSPADRSGLRQHDKILQVNGMDFTMVTHDRAVKCIVKNPVLEMLVARREVAI